MGMIMKDGIPYGGIYPIDDAPTQGSNNAVKSGGVFSSLSGKASKDMISDAYDSTHTYNVGDYCIYNNVLYKCNTASTIGTWDSSKWDAVTVGNEIEENYNKIAVKEDSEHLTAVNDFKSGGNGMILGMFNKEGQNVGHFVFRPKDYSQGYALELFSADWLVRAWALPYIEYREDEYASADANDLYVIPLNDRRSYILSVNVMEPYNVFASNATNADTNYGKAVRLYNYDGTTYTGNAKLKTISIIIPVTS